jgi:hypothetical protein
LESIKSSGLRSRVRPILRIFTPSVSVAAATGEAGTKKEGFALAVQRQSPLQSFPLLSPVTPARRDTRRSYECGTTADETFVPPMLIEQAKTKHLDTVVDLVDEARTWLRDYKETDQWAEPWPTRKERDARILKGLQNGKTWIVWDGNTAAATVTIATAYNPAVWSEPECTCDLTERAVYVHRLITARKYAGCGLGEEPTDWAGLRGRRKNRARWIRIDVWSSNTALHEYYTKRGFHPCGACIDPAYPSGALFQKSVSAIRKRGFPLFAEASELPGQSSNLQSADFHTSALT